MREKKTMLMLAIMTIALAMTLTTSIVWAQEPTPPPSEGKTILYVVGAWLTYSILGLVASLATPPVAGQPVPAFDARKFAKSFLWAIIVAVLAVGFGVHPTTVEAQYTNLITELVNFIGNSGFGLSLIYSFDKLYNIITGLATKIKTTA